MSDPNELLDAARRLLAALWDDGTLDHLDGCPGDDTCDCPRILEVNRILHGWGKGDPVPRSDATRLDFLERNLHHISHARATCSAYMDGTMIFGHLHNEARGSGAGPLTLHIRARNLREAIDNAIDWKPT